MSWNKLFLGIGVGVAGTLILSEVLSQERITPDKALKLAKEAYNQNGKITGSWIHVIPEEYSHSAITYSVFKGGLSCEENNKLQQYDFVVDAKTGCVLELKHRDE